MQTIKISPEGRVQFIWSDKLQPLFAAGVGTISRASHVEPTADGQWTADMGPVNGPVLGPYPVRGEALAAEVSWLNQNVIGEAKCKTNTDSF